MPPITKTMILGPYLRKSSLNVDERTRGLVAADCAADFFVAHEAFVLRKGAVLGEFC